MFCMDIETNSVYQWIMNAVNYLIIISRYGCKFKMKYIWHRRKYAKDSIAQSFGILPMRFIQKATSNYKKNKGRNRNKTLYKDFVKTEQDRIVLHERTEWPVR